MTKNGNGEMVYYQDPPPRIGNTQMSSTYMTENDYRLPFKSKKRFDRCPHTPIQFANLEGPFVFLTNISIVTPLIDENNILYGRCPNTKISYKNIDGTPMINPNGTEIVETT